MSIPPRLVARELCVRFGGVLALDGVDVEVHSGEVVAVIGPNGSGKSTLLDVLSGMTRSDAGRVLLDGRDVTASSPAHLARRGVARTFQIGRMLERLDALENVLLGLHTACDDLGALRESLSVPARHRRDRALCALDEVGLRALWHTDVHKLSHGQRRRVELARALVGRPRALLLDEPTAGLTPSDASVAAVLIARARDRGTAVLIVEHDLDVVGRLAARVVVLDEGRVVAAGTLDDVLGDARIGRLLGITAEQSEAVEVSA